MTTGVIESGQLSTSISSMNPANPLDGSESLEVVQSGTSLRTTVNDIVTFDKRGTLLLNPPTNFPVTLVTSGQANWVSLDLSSVIPANQTYVLLRLNTSQLSANPSGTSASFWFRPTGSTWTAAPYNLAMTIGTEAKGSTYGAVAIHVPLVNGTASVDFTAQWNSTAIPTLGVVAEGYGI